MKGNFTQVKVDSYMHLHEITVVRLTPLVFQKSGKSSINIKVFRALISIATLRKTDTINIWEPIAKCLLNEIQHREHNIIGKR